MSHTADIAEILARETFWSDPKPLALCPDGPCDPGATRIPDYHLLFATSGSCGSPKWIALSKNALLTSANAVNTHLGVATTSVWGLALPPHHVGGFGVIARARCAACKLQALSKSWDPHTFTHWLAERRVTHTSLVPTQVHDLVGAGCHAPGGLVALVIGGGRLDAEAGSAARALGWPVLASYGMTEAASQIATQPPDALARPYKPSPLPVLPHWKTRIHAGGCLEIAGPALFSGTVVDGIYHPRTGEWHVTSDRVLVTPGGLVPQGRADSLVKVAGELIDPTEVENRLAAALQEHRAGVAVVAIRDPRLGKRLVVVAARQVPPSAMQAAIAAYNASVPRSQRMEAPVLVDEIPRGALGKILRPALLQLLGEADSRIEETHPPSGSSEI
jgi:o-succinylbenzoate---CoA ligase